MTQNCIFLLLSSTNTVPGAEMDQPPLPDNADNTGYENDMYNVAPLYTGKY